MQPDYLDRLKANLSNRYEIDREIGAGGMATVFLARDIRHHRRVALKVLKPELAAVLGTERFLNEIEVTANLQHPHLLPLFDSGEADGLLFYVMPYVDGETLRQRIHREGQLSLEEAVRITVAVASALDYAHRKGVIHRDLKPENILLHEGQPMVSDFGIALAVSNAAGARITQTGLSLGTPQYMSPEQATGERVPDGRTDIYSLACVLYEMLAGDPPHVGSTMQAVIAKVIAETPRPVRAMRDTVPEHVDASVRKALAKLPADRFATAAEFADAVAGLKPVDLGALRFGPGGLRAETPITRGAWQERARGLAPWALAILAVAGATALGLRRPASAVPPAQVTINLPPGVTLPMDTEHPVLALSPDGARLVFVGEMRGQRRLYLRELAASEARPLPGTENAAAPFFSPDGGWIGFFDRNTLKRLPTDGGMPVAAREVYGIGVNRGATWIAESTVVIAPCVNCGLHQLSVAGDRRRVIDEDQLPLTGPTEPYSWPAAVPGGRYLLYVDNTAERPEDARVAALSIRSGQSTTLLTGGTRPYYSATGHVLFARDAALYAVEFDRRRGTTSGPARHLLEGVSTESWGAAHYAAAANGTLAYVAGDAVSSEHELVLVDRRGAVTESLLDGRSFYDPRVSPDGMRLAFSSPEAANYDIWVFDLRRRVLTTRLTTHSGEDLHPVWSPLGGTIAFASEIEDDVEPGPGLAWIMGPGEPPERLLRTPEPGHLEFPTSWSPDGEWLAFVAERPGAGANIFLLPTRQPREPRALVATPANERAAMFSPDGRWVAYVSDVSGRDEVYVIPFLGSAEAIRMSTNGGVEPLWGRSGEELFYREGDRLMLVRARGGAWDSPDAPELLFEGRFARTQWAANVANYDVLPDGRFVMIRRKYPVAPTAIQVVLNWPAALSTAAGRSVRR